MSQIEDITERKKYEQLIQLLATTDCLTGVANRREFTSILNKEFARAKRYGATTFALAMYDLDFFKKINDTFGHDVGDHVLQAVTRLTKKRVRAVDVMGRWGGEEFMVLMPQSDHDAACNLAEDLRRTIAEHNFEQVNSISISIGVTQFEAQDDLNSLLKRVDDALYLAKERGRNRVESLSENTRL